MHRHGSRSPHCRFMGSCLMWVLAFILVQIGGHLLKMYFP